MVILRLLHLSDLHIGKCLDSTSFLEDQEYIFNQILGLVKERSIDAILICGDVYDRSTPPVEAVNLLDDILSKFSELVPVYIIGGNHDNIDRLSFGSSILKRSNVYISNKYTGTLERETLTDEYGELDIYLMPYVTSAEVRVAHDVKAKDLTEAFKVVIDSANVDTSRRCVLMAHQYVTSNSNSADDVVAELGGTTSIDYSIFADTFDYTALGHVHKSYWVVPDKVRYCGSPIKYAVRESGNRNSVTIVDFKEKGNVTFEIVPLEPLRNLRTVKGTIDEVLSNPTDTDDYLDVILTDREDVENAMARLRDVYPNVLRLAFENANTRTYQTSGSTTATSVDKSIVELFTDFFRDVYGRDLTDEQNASYLSIVKEAVKKLEEEENKA